MIVTNEIKNYYRRCLLPSFAFRALVSFFSCAFWATLRRLAPRMHLLTQPHAVRQVRQVLLSDPVSSINITPAGFISPGKLKLSVGWLEYEDRPDWSASFSDSEITVSLHRWNWLLLGITERQEKMSREQGLALMRSWLTQCLNDESFGADAYSTGERIVNGSLFLLLTGDGIVPLDIQAALIRMGRQVVEHLEYYEGDRTGNHAFNNARGLLFAGAVANMPGAVNLAFAIARERLPMIVTKAGFLREGSSHYHFLFTRWVLEMIWIAKCYGYEELSVFLADFARRLVDKCWFFLIKDRESGRWHIPLIGDVSPDFTPSWLLSLPWSSPATDIFCPAILPDFPEEHGWADLFGMAAGAGHSIASESVSFPDSFWHRIIHGELTLFLYAAADNGQNRASHRHFDLGGFVLFRAGIPILIDCGRMDYTQSEISNYGKGAYAHNTLIVNGLPPAVNGPTWFQKRYRTVEVNTNLYQTGESTVFTVRHNGFARLAGVKIQHERKFTLRHDAFVAEDQITGVLSCNVLIRFHWAPGIALTQDGETDWSVNASEWFFHQDKQLRAKSLVGQGGAHAGGMYFPEYGLCKECQTLELVGNLTLPTTIKNILSFGD